MTFKEYLIDYKFTIGILLGIIAMVLFYFLINLYFKFKNNKKKTSIPTDEELNHLMIEMDKQKTAKVTHKVEKIIKKESKKEKEIIEDTPVKKLSLLKTKSKLSWDFWRTWYIDKYHFGTAVLINMELVNGFHRTFIVREKEGGFIFRGKKYIFDDDNKYYNIDTKLYAFDYHENIALPIKRKIPVSEIKKTIESSGVTDIEYAINPSTLQRFMTAKIAEGVMKGTQLDEFLRKLNLFVIVIMVIALVHFALFLQASGLLKQINLPFV